MFTLKELVEVSLVDTGLNGIIVGTESDEIFNTFNKEGKHTKTDWKKVLSKYGKYKVIKVWAAEDP